ncbi:hypothetical protein F4778DRAFT_744677 [Xylariomycetidae sp. FL2044]|nr:hypothetical protein F4778DRAFT_744677 [Xylariomycetidae sp. FL2044]
MPLISSPIAYPASSSPPAAKRAKPHVEPRVKAVPKTGFLVDDDSEDEDTLVEPAPKRRMLGSPGRHAAEYTEPSSRPPLVAPANPLESKSQGHSCEPENRAPVFSSLLNSSNTTSIFGRLSTRKTDSNFKITTSSGKNVDVKQRKLNNGATFERMVAARSKTKEGRAKRSFYGIDIHELIDGASKEIANQTATSDPVPDEPMPSVEDHTPKKPRKTLLWTEKYRARNFMDLVGDDLTNRQVLRWLKRWDSLVFPGAAKSRPAVRRPGLKIEAEEEKPHRKILMLTGPPGLGKTTLAHVCARQAGYEVMEINASDDRSRDVVKNRIRTSLGTENVKTVQQAKQKTGKVARPVCVVVDEVDGVVTGSGGSGEGGFIKALMDLITVGEKNASSGQGETTHHSGRRKKKGDDFRQMRPLILICNDAYHPSLRPLRQSSLAEVIRVGKPTIDSVVTRLQTVFEKEGIPCEKDAARKLCEAAWGMSGGIEAKRGAESTTEGDLRGVMVVGEWVAGRIRSAALQGPLCLTRHWVEKNVIRDLSHGGGGARGVGRGNTKDIVTRIFQEGAGFPKGNVLITAPASKHVDEQPKAQLSFSEQQKKYGMERLREMIETSGDVDRVITEVFSEYPTHEFNDDSFLSKPDAAYEWMHFHDVCSSRLFGSQDWELAPYISQPVLACHHLFASPIRRATTTYDKKWGDPEDEAPPLPFSGPRADYLARQSEKENRAMLQALHAQLPPTLMRSFRSPEDISTDFLPYLIRLVSPEVKPVVVGGSGDQRGTASVRKDTEKIMVKRAADVLAETGIELQRGKIESESMFSRGPQWVYRMEPDLDVLATFESSAAVVHGTQAPTRYAVRQVLDQELQKTKVLRENSARQARFRAGNPHANDSFVFDGKENTAKVGKGGDLELPAIPVKKDFFGRIIKSDAPPLQETDGNRRQRRGGNDEALGKGETKVWVTFHEGLNNAVRKPISLDELLRGL